MLLSDLGADVVMVDRKDRPAPAPDAVTHRGRRHLPLDLKNAAAIEACLMLAERADILIEGFRPGVMERLGLGPEVALARNPALRSEEHTSELQSLMRISYAVFCVKKKNTIHTSLTSTS